MVQNDLLNSTEISGTAKLLYIYLISKPDRWNFNVKAIASQMKETKNTINRYLNELEDLRLLLRRKIVTKEGKFTGIIYYVANLDDTTISQKTASPNLVNISNTDISIYKGKEKPLKPTVTLEQRKEAFRDHIRAVSNGQYKDEMLFAFFNHWSELNKSKTKMKYEMENTWETKKRLVTWNTNSENWSNNKESFAERAVRLRNEKALKRCQT